MAGDGTAGGSAAGPPATNPPDEPADRPPQPRRTRDGRVIVGPTVTARYRPGALIGLPLIAALLSPFAAAAIEQALAGRAGADSTGAGGVLHLTAVQLLLGWLALWAALALWAWVPLVLTHRAALLDESAGTVALRRGLRTGGPVPVGDVLHAIGNAERGYSAVIGIGPPTEDGGEARRTWVIPNIGWDDAGFDGLRALQARAGFEPAPHRAVLLDRARTERRIRAHRAMAERIGMPWREEYECDEHAFQREFDHRRRVLGGKESPRR